MRSNNSRKLLSNLTFAQIIALSSSRVPANQELGQRIVDLLNIEAKKALGFSYTESDEAYRQNLITSVCNEIEVLFL